MNRGTGIQRKVFLLLLLTGVACFAAFEAVSLVNMQRMQGSAMESGREMGEFAAAFTEEVAVEQAKARLSAVAAEKAQMVDANLSTMKADTKFLAETMTHILTHRDLYLPRKLPEGGTVPIASKEPYVFYIHKIKEQGRVPELLPEVEIASNAADILSLMAEDYDMGLAASCFYASKEGYFISADVMPKGKEYVEFHEAWYTEDFDPRERLWYKDVQATGKTVFTGVYRGIEGFLCVSCVAPYYDSDGFAGMAVIGNSLSLMYQTALTLKPGQSSINFALNRQGEVVFSSESRGIFAPSGEGSDLRASGETDIAEAAKLMVRGGSSVTQVSVEGKEYYLAYAPISSMGWSIGSLIERDPVVWPAQDAKRQLLARAEAFDESIRSLFLASMFQTAAILLVLMAALYGVSRKVARRFVGPILSLSEGVGEIAKGNLEKTISLRTGDEIEGLSEAVNRMTASLKEHMEHLARTTAEKERIETELSVASGIQSGMLPKEFPQRREFSVFADMKPAKEVGGDFYDDFFLDEHHFIVTVADVSDKGVPAALFMVIAKTLLKEIALMTERDTGLGKVVERVNDQLVKSNEQGMFVTLFTGVLDTRTGEFAYVNAGHTPPLLRRSGGFGFLPIAAAPMLGVMEGLEYPAERIVLEPGDMLFLCTDGVTESMNPAMEFFTEERLRETLDGMPREFGPKDAVHHVLAAVQAHAGEAEQSDDITMLAIQYQG